MLHIKRIVMLFLILVAVSNLVEANEQYIVSFVAGQTRLGLVYVTQSDAGIEVGEASITPMNKIIGSTAVLVQMGYWDYGGSYEVVVINGGDAAKPLEVAVFEFDDALKKIGNLAMLSQIPGQYHPLHLFQADWTDSGCCRTGTLLTAGSGTSGGNNYVSYSLHGRAKTRIFVNPDDRSPGTAAVAADGGMVSQMTYKGLNHIGLIGMLRNGKLVGSPIKWLNVNHFHGYSQSLSNPIGGLRYLVYRNFRQPGSSNSQSQVMIQNVDSKTGKPIGAPRAITKFASAMNVDSEKLQSIAISSNGELILYTAWDNRCQKQILLAHRQVNGSSVGSPQVLVGCRQLENIPLGIYGINITESWPARF